MRILAVRHGETDYNKEHRIMGQEIAAPLNYAGIKQVESLIPELKAHKFEMIYVSPLLRTKETAEIINRELRLKMEFRDELKERSVGNLAGKTYDEILEIIKPKHYDKDYDFREYGGELFEEVETRIHKFFHYIENKHVGHKDDDTELLIVTHAGIIQILYDIFKLPIEQDVRNVCIHSFKKNRSQHPSRDLSNK